MSKTVFVLGAGASTDAGAPLMGTFIQAATEVRNNRDLSAEDAAGFDLVFRARQRLQSVYSKATLNINNIESLFGAFEMAALLGKLADFSPTDVEQLLPAISKVISRTIERRVQYPVEPARSMGGSPRVRPPVPYEAFAELLAEMSQREAHSVAVITFNYDVALDFALNFEGVPVDYCVEPLKKPAKLDVLKLHGSLNWGRCRDPKCAVVVPWYMEEFSNRYNWMPFLEATSVRLEVTDKLETHSHSHCGSPLCREPVIVPPTWNKGRYHHELALVWLQAASHLAEAESVFIVGYSLPETDEFFRYFYALGSVGDSVLNALWIIDPDAGAAARFKKILGATALAPECFHHEEKTFASAIPEIRQRLGIPAKRGKRIG